MQSPASRRNGLVKVDVSQDARGQVNLDEKMKDAKMKNKKAQKIKLTGSLHGSGQLQISNIQPFPR
jgi:hypothetical protein